MNNWLEKSFAWMSQGYLLTRFEMKFKRIVIKKENNPRNLRVTNKRETNQKNSIHSDDTITKMQQVSVRYK
jgi:hypothetical protein